MEFSHPTYLDFQAAFGCARRSMEDPLVHAYDIEDGSGGIARVSFHVVAGSFQLDLIREEALVLQLVDETAMSVSIRKDAETAHSELVVDFSGALSVATLALVQFPTVCVRMLRLH